MLVCCFWAGVGSSHYQLVCNGVLLNRLKVSVSVFVGCFSNIVRFIYSVKASCGISLKLDDVIDASVVDQIIRLSLT